jgi:hypothetical protein
MSLLRRNLSRRQVAGGLWAVIGSRRVAPAGRWASGDKPGEPKVAGDARACLDCARLVGRSS